MVMIMLARVSLALAGSVLLAHTALAAAPSTISLESRLQKRVEQMLGKRAGCVLVYDLRAGRVRAVAHPQTAFASRSPHPPPSRPGHRDRTQ